MTFSAWSSCVAVTSPGWSEWFPAALALMALPGVIYWIVTAVLIARRSWRIESQTIPQEELPPVTFLRPVKKGVPGLHDKARRLLLSARPGDRVLFGVDSPEDLAACEDACAQAPEGVGCTVLLCPPCERGWNPKIEKLIALCGEAGDTGWSPGHWILTDSEALPNRAFMDAFRTEWAAACKPSVLTAGYRFTGAKNLPQKLDHLATLLTLWPGLAAAEQGATDTNTGSRGLGFALGACMGVRREDVQRVGGWETFALSLAEDNRLGAALAEEGCPTRLSRQVLTLDSDPIGWRDWAFHQHRVAVTYRVCNPAGAFGMLFTHGVTWAALSLLFAPLSPATWGLAASVACVRIATARLNAHRLQFLEDSTLLRFALATLAASLAETVFWLLGWLPLPVRWGGRFLKVDARGRLIASAGALPSPTEPEPALSLRTEDRF